MSTSAKKQEAGQLEQVGKLLATRLHEARKKTGVLRCAVCQHIFDGTYVIKCPKCRTLISNSFQKIRRSRTSRKKELDFFLPPQKALKRIEPMKSLSKETPALQMELDFFLPPQDALERTEPIGIAGEDASIVQEADRPEYPVYEGT